MFMRTRILLALPLLLLIGCSRAYKVPTEGMSPTIKKGDTIWVDHRFYHSHPIERFDMVIFLASAHGDPHEGKDTKVVKRVIGLGGEKVEVKAGRVFINGAALQEPFDVIPPSEDFGPVTVPSGEYFLMGDNRVNSFDGRFWQPATIPQSSITGKVTEVKHN
jgi:signal peptidase I